MLLALAAWLARPANGDGLIGNWSPGIGDPTPMGFITVVLYFYAAYRCYRLAKGRGVQLVKKERGVWWGFVAALAALGVNKQLDLQTALTEIGRILAHSQGWYEQRRIVQAEFLILVGLLGLVGSVALLYIARSMPKATRLAMVGGVALIAFIAIRAASFHHIDRLIGRSIFGLRINWQLEIGGIGIIVLGAHLRGRAPKRVASRRRAA